MSGTHDYPHTASDLLRGDTINLIRGEEDFREAEDKLRVLGYRIDSVTCSEGVANFQSQISKTLNWSGQFGYEQWHGNLDAFTDGLRDYPFDFDEPVALSLFGFHQLVHDDPKFARGVLDIIAGEIWLKHQEGKKLLVLVQAEDDALLGR